MNLPGLIRAVAAMSLLSAAPALSDAGLSLANPHVDAGSTVSVPLTLSGATDVVALQADVVFSASVLTAGPATAGPAPGGHTFGSSLPALGVRRILIYSLNNTPLANGVIANLQFTAASRPALTVAPLSFTNVILTSANSTSLGFTVSPGVIIINVAPFITSQPLNQTAIVGGPATFSVANLGTAPLSYQWRFNASNIPGATSVTLFLTNLQPAQEGIYRVLISNPFGTTVSKPATLTVAVPPAITQQPLGTTALPGATVTLAVAAAGTSPLRYQWRRNGINLGGATSAALVLSNIQQGQAGSYDVTVSNVAGAATSSVASVTVWAPLRLDWIIDSTNGPPRLRLTWTADQDFVIQASTNLANWLPVVTNAAPGRVNEFLDSATSLYPQRFFRAKNWP